MITVFIIWLVTVGCLSYLLYRATYFEYSVTDRNLEVKMVWAGFFRIPKRIPIDDICSLERLSSIREIVPLVNGTLPSLWGKFRPSNMIMVSRKKNRIYPLVITPDHPDEFILKLSPFISRT